MISNENLTDPLRAGAAMEQKTHTLSASQLKRFFGFVSLGVFALHLTNVHAEPVRQVSISGPTPAERASDAAFMEQRARCKDSEIKVAYRSDSLHVTGNVKDETVNVDFTDSPLGLLVRDPNLLGTPSIGCVRDGFTLEFSGVKFIDKDEVAYTFDTMIYKKGRLVKYISDPSPLETMKNAEGEVHTVVSTLDPALPRDFRTELVATCPGGRYRVMIDHVGKRIIASSEVTQRFEVDITESKMGRLVFQKRTQGRTSLSCGTPAGAIIEFIGAMAVDAEDDDQTKMSRLHFRARLDVNAALATDAQPAN